MVATLALQPMEQEIVQALGKHGPLTTEQLTRVLRRGGRQCSDATVRVRVNTLARVGIVARQQLGNGGLRRDQHTIWVLAGEVQR